jgi:hypothetical protein
MSDKIIELKKKLESVKSESDKRKIKHALVNAILDYNLKAADELERSMLSVIHSFDAAKGAG